MHSPPLVLQVNCPLGCLLGAVTRDVPMQKKSPNHKRRNTHHRRLSVIGLRAVLRVSPLLPNLKYKRIYKLHSNHRNHSRGLSAYSNPESDSLKRTQAPITTAEISHTFDTSRHLRQPCNLHTTHKTSSCIRMGMHSLSC